MTIDRVLSDGLKNAWAKGKDKAAMHLTVLYGNENDICNYEDILWCGIQFGVIVGESSTVDIAAERFVKWIEEK